MAHVGELLRKKYDSTDGGNVHSITASFLIGAAVGQSAVVVVNAPVNSTAQNLTLTDTQGNTYTRRVVEATSPVNYQFAMFDVTYTTAVSTSDHVTATGDGATIAKWMILGDLFDDLSGFDVSQHASGSSTAPNSGNTATAAQDTELVYGAAAYTDAGGTTTITPASGFTSGGKLVSSTASAPRSLITMWKYVNASGVRAASAVIATSQGWGAGVVAMKQTIPPDAYEYALIGGDWVPMVEVAL